LGFLKNHHLNWIQLNRTVWDKARSGIIKTNKSYPLKTVRNQLTSKVNKKPG
jgi:hypothetical protein